MRKLFFASLAIATASLLGSAEAAVNYTQGFETDTAGWFNYDGGDINRVSSGTNGITSASGNFHAIITNLNSSQGSLGAASPYTNFGGYSSTFGSGFVTSLDIYLDPSWSQGSGFDYSVAANNQSGSHLRDFIWHVGENSGQLLVSASNNSGFAFNASDLSGGFSVGAAGWYTFQQVFRDNGSGALAVDFNLLNSSGTLLYSTTLSTPSDLIATVVGGNRYGWFAYDNIDGLAIDNASLGALPEPGTLLVWGGFGICALVYGFKKRAVKA